MPCRFDVMLGGVYERVLRGWRLGLVVLGFGVGLRRRADAYSTGQTAFAPFVGGAGA